MGGFYTGTDLKDKVFYGFRLDADTSNLNIEILDGDQPVVLPDPTNIDRNDYKQWVWSSDTLQFYWGEKGHLLVRFV